MPIVNLFFCVDQIFSCESSEYFHKICLTEKHVLTEFFSGKLVLLFLFCLSLNRIFEGQKIAFPDIRVLQKAKHEANAIGENTFTDCSNLAKVNILLAQYCGNGLSIWILQSILSVVFNPVSMQIGTEQELRELWVLLFIKG